MKNLRTKMGKDVYLSKYGLLDRDVILNNQELYFQYVDEQIFKTSLEKVIFTTFLEAVDWECSNPLIIELDNKHISQKAGWDFNKKAERTISCRIMEAISPMALRDIEFYDYKRRKWQTGHVLISTSGNLFKTEVSFNSCLFDYLKQLYNDIKIEDDKLYKECCKTLNRPSKTNEYTAKTKPINKSFYQKWVISGKEDKDDRSFWIDILQKIYGVNDATDRIQFQKKVLVNDTIKKIDAYIPETKTLIEQKSNGIILDKKILQSDGVYLTAYEQAKRYNDNLPASQQAHWIITSNFNEFWVYDMSTSEPEKSVLKFSIEDLDKDASLLSFILF